MRSLVTVGLLSIFFLAHSTHAADKPIEIQLIISPELNQYSDTLFESPAYAALALQNSGIPVSLSKPMKILTRQSIQVGSDKLDFIRKKDNVYYYNASIGLPLGKSIDIPVEIDIKNLSSGQLKVSAYPPLAGLMPQDIIVKVESKLQTLANINSQKQFIKYLLDHSKGKMNSETVAQLHESIAFDAYNKAGGSFRSSVTANGQDVGSSEPLSDQALLIISMAIWLVGLPVYLTLVRRRRMKQTPSSVLK